MHLKRHVNGKIPCTRQRAHSSRSHGCGYWDRYIFLHVYRMRGCPQHQTRTRRFNKERSHRSLSHLRHARTAVSSKHMCVRHPKALMCVVYKFALVVSARRCLYSSSSRGRVCRFPAHHGPLKLRLGVYCGIRVLRLAMHCGFRLHTPWR